MKTIVCYGDSNTWGYMPKREQPMNTAANRFPWGVRWTSLLQMELGEDYHVVEEGVNGRTTVFEAPFELGRSGIEHIDACLLASFPVDLVIIMLGTNDIKEFYANPPYAVRLGAQALIEKIKRGGYGPDDGLPEILLVSPIRLNKSYVKGWLCEEFGPDTIRKDAQLPEQLKAAAEAMHVHFLNASEAVTADEADGIHMNADGHRLMANLMLSKVREILG